MLSHNSAFPFKVRGKNFSFMYSAETPFICTKPMRCSNMLIWSIGFSCSPPWYGVFSNISNKYGLNWNDAFGGNSGNVMGSPPVSDDGKEYDTKVRGGIWSPSAIGISIVSCPLCCLARLEPALACRIILSGFGFSGVIGVWPRRERVRMHKRNKQKNQISSN